MKFLSSKPKKRKRKSASKDHPRRRQKAGHVLTSNLFGDGAVTLLDDTRGSHGGAGEEGHDGDLTSKHLEIGRGFQSECARCRCRRGGNLDVMRDGRKFVETDMAIRAHPSTYMYPRMSRITL